MTTLIKPTVGRDVWYRPTQADTQGIGRMFTLPGQPLAAKVLAVWGDRMVNVQVTDIGGRQFPITSCPLVQEGDPVPDQGGYVEWMPFQLGRAREDAVKPAAESTSKADKPAFNTEGPDDWGG